MNFLLIMPDRSYLRDAIRAYLETEIAGVEVNAVACIEEVSDRSLKELSAISLVMVHIGMSKVEDPVVSAVVEETRSKLGSVPTVLLGDLPEDQQTEKALQLGTNGYISVETPGEILKHALPIVANGGYYAPPFVHGPQVNDVTADGFAETAAHYRPNSTKAILLEGDGPPTAFTKRELEVLALLGEGLQNKVIAHRLDLREGTVKVHVRHIMKKLRVTSRTQAALYSQRITLPRGSG